MEFLKVSSMSHLHQNHFQNFLKMQVLRCTLGLLNHTFWAIGLSILHIGRSLRNLDVDLSMRTTVLVSKRRAVFTWSLASPIKVAWETRWASNLMSTAGSSERKGQNTTRLVPQGSLQSIWTLKPGADSLARPPGMDWTTHYWRPRCCHICYIAKGTRVIKAIVNFTAAGWVCAGY